MRMKPFNHFVWRVLLLSLPILSPIAMHPQAQPTAYRSLDVQAGGSFVLGRSNYLPWDTDAQSAPLSDLTRTVKSMGGGVYVAADFMPHFGAELNIRHLAGSDNGGSQTSYELGGRYLFLRRESFNAYSRVSYGRGVYSYPSNVATLSFNLFSAAGGVDYHLNQAINIRAEYEWQHWLSVPLRDPAPQTLSIGVAYRFH